MLRTCTVGLLFSLLLWSGPAVAADTQGKSTDATATKEKAADSSPAKDTSAGPAAPKDKATDAAAAPKKSTEPTATKSTEPTATKEKPPASVPSIYKGTDALPTKTKADDSSSAAILKPAKPEDVQGEVTAVDADKRTLAINENGHEQKYGIGNGCKVISRVGEGDNARYQPAATGLQAIAVGATVTLTLDPKDPTQAIQVAIDAPPPTPWYQQTWFLMSLVALVLIVPYTIGEMLGRSLRMPDYGWKIGLILVAISAGLLIDLSGRPKLGIDLSGGVKLIYELDQGKLKTDTSESLVRRLSEDATKAGGYAAKKVKVNPLADREYEIRLPDDDAAQADKVEKALESADLNKAMGVTITRVDRHLDGNQIVLVYQANQGASVDMDKLVQAVAKRVNPGGQREVALRSLGGSQIEVAIPDVDKTEIEQIKSKIASAGALEFRILADKNKEPDIIDLATHDIDNPADDVSNGDEVVARWVNIAADSDVHHIEPAWLTRDTKAGRQVLVLVDPADLTVTGAHLTRARLNIGQKGPEVEFSLDAEGANRFGELTGNNLPEDNGHVRFLGIVLDGVLMSAPSIRGRITDNGQITGDFTEAKVNWLVDVLNAGSLPAALQKEPISEERISAELGSDTIRASAYSMIVSTLLVLAFMLVYYRFAGMVANAAVLLNLMLVLALMIIFKAAFTLSGLAGLVLSVGMAVDSNVLIYERMREEKERGAAMRMVIRNGFGRAMTTIIDTHMTTIITGVILFAIGTEQLRGFAVTLVMGLVVNLFTAVFCARVVFDIAERKRWLTELKMMKLFGETNIDFVRITKPAIAVSLIISLLGVWAVWQRGPNLWDIDFTGGSEVQTVFNKDNALDVAQVRRELEKPEVAKVLPDMTVSTVTTEANADPQFVVRTSNQDLKEVEAELAQVFGDHLRKYKVVATEKPRLIEAAPAPEPKKNEKPASGPAKGNPPAKSDEPSKDTAPKEPKQPSAPKSPSDTDKKKTSALPPASRAILALVAPDAFLAADTDATSKSSDAQKDAKKPADEKSPEPKAPDAKTSVSKGSDSKTPDANPPAAKEPEKKPSEGKGTDATPPPAKGSEPAKQPTPAKEPAPANPTPDTSAAVQAVAPAKAKSFVGGTQVTLEFDKDEPIKYDNLKDQLLQQLDAVKNHCELSNPKYDPKDPKTAELTFSDWTLKLAKPIALDDLKSKLDESPATRALGIEISNPQHSGDGAHPSAEWTLKLATAVNHEKVAGPITSVLDPEVAYDISTPSPDFLPGDTRAYANWTVKLSWPPSKAAPLLDKLTAQLANSPVFLGDSRISGRVAEDTKWKAVEAILVSIVMIVIYIWIRFQNVIFGIGAVVALVHDVFVTVAGVALSYYVADYLGWLGVDPFKISLNVVAAVLTIVGYSISDTIVIFDRIREVRGKSPDLTEEMINKSVNQTLSRTVLTVFTVLLVTTVLYFAGGQAIHAFAFTMLIGLISGTYSSVYIAAPVLLWLKLPGGEKGGGTGGTGTQQKKKAAA